MKAVFEIAGTTKDKIRIDATIACASVIAFGRSGPGASPSADDPIATVNGMLDAIVPRKELKAYLAQALSFMGA